MILTVETPIRLDEFIKQAADITRSRAQKLIAEGCVSVNGAQPQKNGQMLKAGDSVSFEIPQARPIEAVAQELPLEIVYEDDWLAVVNKPLGMVVHPAAGNIDGTLVNALLAKLDHLSGIGGELRPGIVHRIDKDTTGLLLVAKNDEAHLSLSAQIAEHTVGRVYLAILNGTLKNDHGVVDAPIGRHPTDRKKMAIVKNGKSAVTEYRLLQNLNNAALVEARLQTGRTHQIRVHMASLGRPVLGDPVYGPSKRTFKELDHQLLHACRIAFNHPSSGQRMTFVAPPPAEFIDYFIKLGGDINVITDTLTRYMRPDI